jgi:rhomboid protease GluP
MTSVDPKPQAFEFGLKYGSPATVSLIVLLLAVFSYQACLASSSNFDEFVRLWGCLPEAVWQGQLWRPVTAGFIHLDAEHFLGNAIMLYIAGIGVEHGVGAKKTVAIFVVPAVLGNVASLFTEQDVVHLGASGGVFALIGALIAFLYLYRERYYVRDKRIGIVFLIWSLYSIVTAAFVPGVDNTAHVIGFIAGAGMVWMFWRKGIKEVRDGR